MDRADSLLIDKAGGAASDHLCADKEQLLKEAEASLQEQVSAELELGGLSDELARYKEIELTDTGREKLAGRAQQLPGLWRSRDRRTG